MMPVIQFRCPPELLKAAEILAGGEGLSVGEWTRTLVEKATGVQVKVVKGLGGVDEKTKKRIQRLGAKAGGLARAKMLKKKASAK